MTPRNDRRPQHPDRGQALVMILVCITVFGAIVAALLNHAYTELRSFETFRAQRSRTYSAAGATDTAIQYLRSNSTLAEYGAACPSVVVTTNSTSATVTCTNTGGFRNTDRVLTLVATVGGVAQLNASIIIRDSKVVSGSSPTVDILSWNYLR